MTMIQTRKGIEGPESALLTAARRVGFPGAAPRNAVFFDEPRLMTGFPDLVIAVRAGLPKGMGRTVVFTKLHYQILSHIYSGSTSDDIEGIARDLSISEITLRRILEELQKEKLIGGFDSEVETLPLNRAFKLSRIVAIEAKVKDWKKAIAQAVANTWFCSESYVLLPRLRNLDFICASAQAAGIGVFVASESEVVESVKPTTLEIPRSFASWMINDWALSRAHD